jgi:hypothetical protein
MQKMHLVYFPPDISRLINSVPLDDGKPLVPALGSNTRHAIPPCKGKYFLAKEVATGATGYLRPVEIVDTLTDAVTRALQSRTAHEALLDGESHSTVLRWEGGLEIRLDLTSNGEVMIGDIFVSSIPAEAKQGWSKRHAPQLDPLKGWRWPIRRPELSPPSTFGAAERRYLRYLQAGNKLKTIVPPPLWLLETVRDLFPLWMPVHFSRNKFGPFWDCSRQTLRELIHDISEGDLTIQFHETDYAHCRLEWVLAPKDRHIWNREHPFEPLPVDDPHFWQHACEISGIPMHKTTRIDRNSGKRIPFVSFFLSVGIKIFCFSFPESVVNKEPEELYRPDHP